MAKVLNFSEKQHMKQNFRVLHKEININETYEETCGKPDSHQAQAFSLFLQGQTAEKLAPQHSNKQQATKSEYRMLLIKHHYIDLMQRQYVK